MTRIITFLFIYLLNNLVSFAQIKTEDITIKNDSILLPGTLTFNQNNKQPLLIFVPGSGNPDRNGNQPDFNVNPDYIKQLSNSLTANNLAFFRYDKRNVTKENIKHILKQYVFEDLVKDVSSIIENFKEDKRFTEIILIGHSQGSLVAMLAVNQHIDKYISLAGLGESADKALTRQITAQSPILGETAKQHLTELKNTKSIKEIHPFLSAIFTKQNHEFLVSYIKYNPSEEIQKITIPTLIINGTKDFQVPVEDAKALHNANPSSELQIITNMNHVLKHIEKEDDNMKSYTTPDFSISKELITAIVNFAKQ